MLPHDSRQPIVLTCTETLCDEPSFDEPSLESVEEIIDYINFNQLFFQQHFAPNGETNSSSNNSILDLIVNQFKKNLSAAFKDIHSELTYDQLLCELVSPSLERDKRLLDFFKTHNTIRELFSRSIPELRDNMIEKILIFLAYHREFFSKSFRPEFRNEIECLDEVSKTNLQKISKQIYTAVVNSIDVRKDDFADSVSCFIDGIAGLENKKVDRNSQIFSSRHEVLEEMLDLNPGLLKCLYEVQNELTEIIIKFHHAKEKHIKPPEAAILAESLMSAISPTPQPKRFRSNDESQTRSDTKRVKAEHEIETLKVPG